MGERNSAILKSIEAGKVPMLSFEFTLAKESLVSHLYRQGELGRKLGEMMQQSSETWHDNAPAEAITDESKILASTAEKTIRIINNAEVFDYSDDGQRVTLGSLVELRYAGDDETTLSILTGVAREIPKEVIGLEDVECVTIASPLGKSIFNKKKGDRLSYSVNGRSLGVEIINVCSVGL